MEQLSCGNRSCSLSAKPPSISQTGISWPGRNGSERCEKVNFMSPRTSEANADWYSMCTWRKFITVTLALSFILAVLFNSKGRHLVAHSSKLSRPPIARWDAPPLDWKARIKYSNNAFLAILCKSAPGNYNRRENTRQLINIQRKLLQERGFLHCGSKGTHQDLPVSMNGTIYSALCHKRELFSFHFVMGRTSLAPRLLSHIQREIRLYSDVMVGEFTDKYENLTQKLLWILQRAIQTLTFEYLLIMDDDAFVNIDLMLRRLWTSPRTQLYGGSSSVSLRTPVFRTVGRRWYVSKAEYSENSYPPYHVGVGVVLTKDVVNATLRYARNVTRFGVDDAFMGVVIQRYHLAVMRKIPGMLKMKVRCKPGMHPMLIGNMPEKILEKITHSYRTIRDYQYIC